MIKNIKLQISKIQDIKELYELEKYCKHRIAITRKRNREKEEKERIEKITGLSPGTRVVFSYKRDPEFLGKIGVIVRHLGRGSENSIVKFDDQRHSWRVPRSWLSGDLSENHLKELEGYRKMAKKGQEILNQVFGK